MAQTATDPNKPVSANNGTEQSSTVKKHAISLYVANKPGVLIRIALVFARRGYNIDSLVVSEAHDPAFSAMNIEATGEGKTLDQILTQLNKLVDVVHARDNTIEDVITCEVALIKLTCTAEQRAEVLQLAQALESEIIDLTESTVTLQVSGDTKKIDTVHTVCAVYGILEMVRSGKIIIARGELSTS